MPLKNLEVGCIQMRSGVSVRHNRDVMRELVTQAAKAGARYIQTPEMTGILQKNKSKLFESITSQKDDLVLNEASKLAAELGIWLHVGSTAVRVSKDRAANRAVLFSPVGEVAAVYDKMHMFDVDLDNGERWRESAIYDAGQHGLIVNTGNFSLGLSICYDLRFPELYRMLALGGANLMACPAAFTKQTGKAHWHILVKARAIETGSFVVAAAQGGQHEDGRETYGHSVVVNPWGETVAEIDNDEPGYVVCTINLAESISARNKIPNLANRRDLTIQTTNVTEDEFVGESA